MASIARDLRVKLFRRAMDFCFLCRCSRCGTFRSVRLANEIRLVSKSLRSCHIGISFRPMAGQCMKWLLQLLLASQLRSTREASLQLSCWPLGLLLDLSSWCILFSECLWSLRTLWSHRRLAWVGPLRSAVSAFNSKSYFDPTWTLRLPPLHLRLGWSKCFATRGSY